MIPPGSELLPERSFFLEEPSITVARPVIHLTVFLRNGRAWAYGEAGRLLTQYMTTIERSTLSLFRTSADHEWRQVNDTEREEVVAHLDARNVGGSLRRFFKLELADDPWCPTTSFRYLEVDDSAGTQHGYVQLVWPVTTPLERIVELATAFTHDYPVWCAVGGWGCTYNAMRPRNAFTTLFAWCKRWLGLGLSMPDVESRFVRDGLPSVGWLTLVSRQAATQWGVNVADCLGRAREGVRVVSSPNATLVRAGEHAEVGDLNLFQYPRALAHVSQCLSPLVLETLPPLPGGFRNDAALTRAWRRRFVEPELWT